jgi:hypothetical protein
MPDGYPIQTNFTSGEVSPLLRGRVDISKYFNGAKKLQNMVVKTQGGITRRPGTRHVYEVKTSGKLTLLQRFEFSSQQAYVLEFGDLYIRIYKNGGILTSSGIPVEIVTPYTEADLRGLYFTQSADVLYICHPSYQPRTLSRLSETNWVLAPFTTKDGPFLDMDSRDYTMTLTSIVNRATLKSTANDFVVGDVGKYVEYPYKSQLVVGKIITYVSATEVVIEPYENIIDTTSLDERTVLSYVAGSSTPAKIAFNGFTDASRAFVLPTNTNIVTPASTHIVIPTGSTLTPNTTPTVSGEYLILKTNGSETEPIESPVGMKITPPGASTQYNFPTGWNYTAAGGGSWPNRIRSSIGVWEAAHENSFIKVDAFWYKTGKHFLQSESYDATPGGTTVVDVMEVTETLDLKATTGILSFSNHAITAQLNCSNNVFASTDVGRQFRLTFSSQKVWGTIVTYTDQKTVQVTLGRMMPPSPKKLDTYLNNAKTLEWQLGAWYTGNYPSCVCFHEERLVFANTLLQPQTLWLSKSADYNNFATTETDSKVLDDSAITYTVSSGEVNSIVWLVSSNILLFGTIGGEWQVKSSSINEALTPTNFSATQQTAYGSSSTVRPRKIGSSVFFCQRSGGKLRELSYDFQQDSFVGKDMTVVSEHILREYGGAVVSGYQREPNSIFWTVTNNGALIGFTFEKDQEVTAWHRHIIGGSYNSGIAVVESMAIIPSSDVTKDVVYLIVKRTINGSTKRYVEMIVDEFNPSSDTDLNNMLFLDSHLTYTGSPVGTVSGLGHLEGQTVQIIADGTLRTQQTVASGAVSIIGGNASTIHVGLHASSIVGSLPIEAGSNNGTAQGKTKRVQKLVLRLINSLTFKSGPDESSVVDLGLSTTQLVSSDKSIDLNQDYGLTGEYVVVQDKPYPLTIIAIMPQLQTNL